MDTLRVEIINPKAKMILQNLADLNLINITSKEPDMQSFFKLLGKLRANAKSAPSLEEIAKEVKAVRKKRNGK